MALRLYVFTADIQSPQHRFIRSEHNADLSGIIQIRAQHYRSRRRFRKSSEGLNPQGRLTNPNSQVSHLP